MLLQLIFALIIAQTLAFGSFPTPTASRSSSSIGGGEIRSRSNANVLSNIPIVICPGFGNDELDYSNPLNQGDEYGFVAALTRRGLNPDLISVLPLQRYEWIRVAGGLFDIPNFYTNNCLPDGLGYGWYVKRLRETIEEAYTNAGRSERVILIGHSAGGWLARAALGDGSWDTNNVEGEEKKARVADRVRALITVGAIHKPPAGDALSTCVTRGALSYLDKTYPGAYLRSEGVTYVSVGGDAVLGKQQPKSTGLKDGDESKQGSKEVNEVYKVRGEGSQSVAYTSYSAVSGNGELTGDGVVPLEWALLEGSRTIVLDGVVHSINEAGTTLPTERWYGSERVIDRWLYEALEEAGIDAKQSNDNLFMTMLESFLRV